MGLFITLKYRMRHSSVQTTQNYADLPNSDVGEQVGRVYIKSYLYTKSTQEYRQTKKALLTLHHE